MELTNRIRAALEDLRVTLAIWLDSLAYLWARLTCCDMDVSRTFESGSIQAVAVVWVEDGEVERSIELQHKTVTVNPLPPIDKLTLDDLYDSLTAYHMARTWVQRF